MQITGDAAGTHSLPDTAHTGSFPDIFSLRGVTELGSSLAAFFTSQAPLTLTLLTEQKNGHCWNQASVVNYQFTQFGGARQDEQLSSSQRFYVHIQSEDSCICFNLTGVFGCWAWLLSWILIASNTPNSMTCRTWRLNASFYKGCQVTSFPIWIHKISHTDICLFKVISNIVIPSSVGFPRGRFPVGLLLLLLFFIIFFFWKRDYIRGTWSFLLWSFCYSLVSTLFSLETWSHTFSLCSSFYTFHSNTVHLL